MRTSRLPQDKNGFRPSKALGQNFLIDMNIADKIIRLSGADKSCGILEVGPGFGALTKKLIISAGFVTAVEKDAYLASKLLDELGSVSNFKLINGDILKTDLSVITGETFGNLDAHVCANLPYNITTPAIARFIDAGVFKSITVMVQKEVAQRICACPGTAGYGAFTVFAHYHTEAEVLFDVPPECFLPRPKVVSSVVRLKIREQRLLNKDDEKRFFKIVRASFAQRRKTLVNALFATLGSSISKDGIATAVTQCGFDVNIRGETLSIEDFIRLTEIL